ncbi:MAG TPA: thiol:disulfide interchange protein DsbA/DsbL [Burkholderiales bacterium]|nr:thiol:disulfide interchange protein DsbA/DsbL [Burkholderiales bacterium]
MRRRAALKAIAGGTTLALLALAGRAAAQEIRARQNIEYRVLASPQPVETGANIEVIDFFWYGCPYCNELQPALFDWIKKKPADVTVRHIPAILKDNWAPHARIYYALELLGEVERLHLAVYHSYHVEELFMSKPDVMEQWAVKNGIERRRWMDAYYSPEVDAKISRAFQATKRYDIQGTPSLVVDGRYLTSSSMTPRVSGVIAVVDDLIKLARQNRSK